MAVMMFKILRLVLNGSLDRFIKSPPWVYCMVVLNQGYFVLGPLTRVAIATTCRSHFHKLNFPHNNKRFLEFNITFFIIIFKLYM